MLLVTEDQAHSNQLSQEICREDESCVTELWWKSPPGRLSESGARVGLVLCLGTDVSRGMLVFVLCLSERAVHPHGSPLDNFIVIVLIHRWFYMLTFNPVMMEHSYLCPQGTVL